MSESDHLLAAIECCGARAKIAGGKLDQFTPMPSRCLQREDVSQAQRGLAGSHRACRAPSAAGVLRSALGH